jgi:tellurite resistance protein
MSKPPGRGLAALQQLTLAWFAMVMGLCGLSLAWQRAAPWWGEAALVCSTVLGVCAAVVLALLVLAILYKAWRFPVAWLEDVTHPVRHVFVAAVPSSFILLSTVMVALQGPSAWANALWMGGSACLFAATVWVAQRWLHPSLSAEAFWAAMTPAIFIPVVGNVLPALAGGTLGHSGWAGMQYALAAVLWPVSLTLVWVRIGMVGLWPERMLPATFVTIAPPAVLGLSGAQLGMPEWAVQMAWGLALFFTLWSLGVVRRCRVQPFGMVFWGLSFPLAACAALSLHLVPHGQGAWALAWLLLVSAVILWLVWRTLQGLAQGDLLAPELALQGILAAPEV